MRSIILGGMAAVFLALPARSHAQEGRTDFSRTLRELRQGIFLVGSPKVGTGAAWVISKQHRLLATNAHVADLFSKCEPDKLLAMMNGSDQIYVVERVYYHPGVSRFASKDENFSLRASNPKFGEVNPACPDVAVLQLSADGPDLPVELKMAGPRVIFDLQGLPAAMLGFPGHDTASWPKAGRSAQATFHTGVVSRVSDFQFEGGVRSEFAQLLQYTMESFNGFSGAPVFLANGEVVGLHNSVRTIDKTRKVAHGIRVDSLWELLAHHKLDDRVAIPVNKNRLLLQRWLEPDPNLEKYNALKKLEADAIYLNDTKLDFVAGIAKCNAALAIYAKYAPIYRIRCYGYVNWHFRAGDNWGLEKQLSVLLLALADAERYIELHNGPLSYDALLAKIVVLNNLGYVSKQNKYNATALNVVNKILEANDVPNFERALALSHKGVALSNLDRADEARQAHDRALQVYPDSPILWDNRADFLANNGAAGSAQSDRAMAKALRKRDSLLRETGRKDFKVISKVEEKLTNKDPRDGRGRFHQLWTVELEQGYYYQIDLKSPAYQTAKDYDPILRLADDKNRVIQEDDDGGGFPNARIFFTPTRTATYNLYVTSYLPAQTGPFVLTVTRLGKEP